MFQSTNSLYTKFLSHLRPCYWFESELVAQIGFFFLELLIHPLTLALLAASPPRCSVYIYKTLSKRIGDSIVINTHCGCFTASRLLMNSNFRGGWRCFYYRWWCCLVCGSFNMHTWIWWGEITKKKGCLKWKTFSLKAFGSSMRRL